MTVASSTQALVDQLVTELENKYKISRTDHLESILGLHLTHNQNGTLTISQPGYLRDLLEEHDLSDCSHITSPMESDFSDQIQDASPPCDVNAYMKLLGQLIFLLRSRPDITFAVNRLATRTTKCTQADYQALQRILRYLSSTASWGLTFHPQTEQEVQEGYQLYCWADAAFGIHPDSYSQTGLCFSLGLYNGMFYSSSTKQSNITLSTCEAENLACLEATKDIIWYRAVLKELEFEQLQPTCIFTDNQSNITISTNFSGNHKRVKHYLHRVNFLMEHARSGSIRFQYVPSQQLVADVLTKPLPSSEFRKHALHLLGLTHS
jgi:hypothetical protein